MRIEPINFRDFSSDGQTTGTARKSSYSHRRKDEPPPPPPPPTFTEEQLKTAEAEGYKKGFIDGTKEGHQQAQSEQAEVNRALVETAEKFITTLYPILEDYRAMILQLRQDLPKVALAIAQKVANDALQENARAAVESIALNCVQTMIGEPRIAITVHSSLVGALEQKLKEIGSHQQSTTEFIVVASDTIALADCRVEWKHGAMERHTGQLWQEIEKVVCSMSAAAPRETQKQIEALTEQLPPAPSAPIIETGKE